MGGSPSWRRPTAHREEPQGAPEFIVEYTEGYPYFVQEHGKAVWDFASEPTTTLDDAKHSQALVEEKLDSSFFKVRLDRCTDLERAYLRAMADSGSLPQPNYGYAAFTVPQFDRYLKRTGPLVVPPKRRPRRPRRGPGSPHDPS